jgi:L-seryl-tRNA(Ser) seleniumtransferase
VPGDAETNRRLRDLPGVDRVMAALGSEIPEPVIASAARRAVDTARAVVLRGEPTPSFEDVVASARVLLSEHGVMMLREVINATGVLIHTNLGRIPLGDAQLDAVRTIAGGYSNLEYDIRSGRRGSRYAHARTLIAALTGAESALVVNNNAAAVLLVLSALCAGRDVIISRGELVEIGGEFRIPDVMTASGARLKEVGTTNRTHIADYERAITAETAAIMKVHQSNYRMVGFTAEVPPRELARLARGRGVLLINDLGSGLVVDKDLSSLRSEPLVSNAIADGADVITFSGDKLLGGPQAGIIAGRAEIVSELSNHPLVRALRVDKMTLAALEVTLSAYLRDTLNELPLWAMLTAPESELRERAAALARAVNGTSDAKVEVVPIESVTGGGSAPGMGLPSWGIGILHPERGADEVDAALRTGDPPVIPRIDNDRVMLDMRTVPVADDDRLAEAVIAALRRGDSGGRGDA